MLTLYSTAYLANESSSDISIAQIDESLFLKKLDELHCTRLFAALTFPTGDTKYVAVTLSAGADEDSIYLPHWMIPADSEMGEDVEVEFMSDEAFPEATKIILRPLDSAFYSTDAQEELTACLTRLGVVQAETIIHARMEGLEGYEMGFYIVECKPTSLVLCSGDEVAIEFEEACDLWDRRRPSTPAPAPALELPEILFPMIPSSDSEVVPLGNTLGGGPIRRMIDGRPWNPWR